jgi:hypothetical protein
MGRKRSSIRFISLLKASLALSAEEYLLAIFIQGSSTNFFLVFADIVRSSTRQVFGYGARIIQLSGSLTLDNSTMALPCS